MARQNDFDARNQRFREWVEYLVNDLKQPYDFASAIEALDGQIAKVQERALAAVADEPNDYAGICRTRPGGEAPLSVYPVRDYAKKIRGALLGRYAGCTLGVPVEGWQIDAMRRYAEENGETFPPQYYWETVTNPDNVQYDRSKRRAFTRSEMDGVPADDDVMYPLSNLLLMEKYGKHFTVEDVGQHWLDNMTICCTAEYEAMESLKRGVPAAHCADNNPYVEWIGAAIRADAFGYAAPGDMELAAKMAYTDAYLSHRTSGIYGEMYFAAVIARAFTAASIKEALLDGLSVIPAHCRLAADIRWAIETAPQIHDYLAARQATDARLPGLFWVHTRNNACLIIFALLLAGEDFDTLISQCVAMGHDNDCTTATAGSIFGAFYGIDKIDPKWYAPFHDKIQCFLKGDAHKLFSVEDVLRRFTALAEREQ